MAFSKSRVCFALKVAVSKLCLYFFNTRFNSSSLPCEQCLDFINHELHAIIQLRFINFALHPFFAQSTAEVLVKLLVDLLEAQAVELLIVLDDDQVEVELGEGQLQLLGILPHSDVNIILVPAECFLSHTQLLLQRVKLPQSFRLLLSVERSHLLKFSVKKVKPIFLAK